MRRGVVGPAHEELLRANNRGRDSVKAAEVVRSVENGIFVNERSRSV